MTEIFKGCGKQAGLKIWAVNKLELQVVPEKEHGIFYAGDAYLILNSHQAPSGTLFSDIHFWLGKDCSVDEQGAVAVFAAQLDEHLGGVPVQHRQAQGFEDEAFKKLFPKVVIRPKGRFSSGLHSARMEKSPAKLYHIKSPSKAQVQVVEVPLKVSSLNSGDCFVLEDPASGYLYLWHGSAANIREKMRALDVANSLRVNSSVKFSVVDDGELSSADAAAFFLALGASDPASVVIPAAVPDTNIGGSAAMPVLRGPRLFRCLKDSALEELSGPLSKRQLDSEGQYCVLAPDGAWVWTGSKAKAGLSFGVGTHVLELAGLPMNSAIRCIREGYEPGLFITFFPDWGREQALQARAAAAAAAAAGPPPPPQLDLQSVASDMVLAAIEPGVAEKKKLTAAMDKYGTEGDLEVWVARDSKLQSIPKQEQGELYSSDSYVIDYYYADGSGDVHHVVYFWIGRHSSNAEQGTAALLATEKHHEYQVTGFSTLARVAQNQEPPHFVRIFSKLGGLVVHKGDRPPAGSKGAAAAQGPEPHLYQVKAEAALGGPHAVEVDAIHLSLNSGDCFVLVAGGDGGNGLYCWMGQYSSEEEQATAAAAAAKLAAAHQRKVTSIKEGSEGSGFWTALGGQGNYPHCDPAHLPSSPPVLFNFRDTGGAAGVKVEPNAVFSQEELCADDVAMLDSGRELFLWFGSGCTAEERTRAVAIARQYAAQLEQQYPNRMGVQASIIQVECGKEPPFFTQHFPGWDTAPRRSVADVYAEKLRSMSFKEE